MTRRRRGVKGAKGLLRINEAPCATPIRVDPSTTHTHKNIEIHSHSHDRPPHKLRSGVPCRGASDRGRARRPSRASPWRAPCSPRSRARPPSSSGRRAWRGPANSPRCPGGASCSARAKCRPCECGVRGAGSVPVCMSGLASVTLSRGCLCVLVVSVSVSAL